MDSSTIRAGRTKAWLRLAWLVALVSVIMMTLTAMERTGAGDSAAPEPPEVDVPLELANASAANTANVSNSSDGTATIRTGDARATGVSATTNVSQRANVAAFRGLAIINQDVNIAISGTAVANTGGNTAVGNASRNTAISSSSSHAS